MHFALYETKVLATHDNRAIIDHIGHIQGNFCTGTGWQLHMGSLAHGDALLGALNQGPVHGLRHTLERSGIAAECQQVIMKQRADRSHSKHQSIQERDIFPNVWEAMLGEETDASAPERHRTRHAHTRR